MPQKDDKTKNFLFLGMGTAGFPLVAGATEIFNKAPQFNFNVYVTDSQKDPDQIIHELHGFCNPETHNVKFHPIKYKDGGFNEFFSNNENPKEFELITVAPARTKDPTEYSDLEKSVKTCIEAAGFDIREGRADYRMAHTIANWETISDYADLFARHNIKGLVDIFTNQPDIFAYLWASKTSKGGKYNVTTVFGNNHPDTYRLRRPEMKVLGKLINQYKSEAGEGQIDPQDLPSTDAWCGGMHGTPSPFLRGFFLGDLPGPSTIGWEKRETYEALRKRLIQYSQADLSNETPNGFLLTPQKLTQLARKLTDKLSRGVPSATEFEELILDLSVPQFSAAARKKQLIRGEMREVYQDVILSLFGNLKTKRGEREFDLALGLSTFQIASANECLTEYIKTYGLTGFGDLSETVELTTPDHGVYIGWGATLLRRPDGIHNWQMEHPPKLEVDNWALKKFMFDYVRNHKLIDELIESGLIDKPIVLSQEEINLASKSKKDPINLRGLVTSQTPVIQSIKTNQVKRIDEILADTKLDSPYDIFAVGEKNFLHIIAEPGKNPSEWTSTGSGMELPFMARGVNVVQYEGKKYLAIGYGDSVELRDLNAAKQGRMYTPKSANKLVPGTSGFYSIGIHDGKLFASHSVLGGYIWNMDKPKREEGKIKNGAKGGIRFSQIVNTNEGPKLLYVENGHKINATSLTNIDDIIPIYDTYKSPSDHGSKKVMALTYDGDLIYAGIENGETIIIKAHNLSYLEGPKIPEELKTRSLHAMTWLPQKYLSASDQSGHVVIFDPKNPNDNVLPHSSSGQGYLGLDSLPGFLCGANGCCVQFWSLDKLQKSYSQNNWQGKFMDITITKK